MPRPQVQLIFDEPVPNGQAFVGSSLDRKISIPGLFVSYFALKGPTNG